MTVCCKWKLKLIFWLKSKGGEKFVRISNFQPVQGVRAQKTFVVKQLSSWATLVLYQWKKNPKGVSNYDGVKIQLQDSEIWFILYESAQTVKLNYSNSGFCEHISSLVFKTFVAEFSGQEKFNKKFTDCSMNCTRIGKKLNTCSGSTCPYYEPDKNSA